jgi:hypothetical protein
MNAFEFIINYKKLLSMIEQVAQPQFLKYTYKLRKEKPWSLIKSNTTFNSEIEALGFVFSHVLNLFYEDLKNLDFDDDEFLLFADDWFMQAMNLEFGKSKNTLKDNPLVWITDLSMDTKRKEFNFKIEVFYDKKTKSVKEFSTTGFTKKNKKFIGYASAIFLGEDIDDLIKEIYEMANGIIKEYKP